MIGWQALMAKEIGLWPQWGGPAIIRVNRLMRWTGDAALATATGGLAWKLAQPTMTERDFAEHVQIIGGTGSGKTNALHHLLLTGARHGWALVAFHQTLDDANQLKAILTTRAQYPVIRINPLDPDNPGVNVLESPAEPMAWDRVAQTVRTIFEDQGPQGHAMAQVIEMAAYAVLEGFAPEVPTLRHLVQFLVTPSLRTRVVQTLQNPIVKLYWDQVFEAQAKSAIRDAASILNVLRSPALQRTLGTPHGLNVADALTQPQCLQIVCDRDTLGPTASQLFGKLWVSVLEQLTYQRDPHSRMVLVGADEWPLYRTRSLERCLEQGRRHRVGWILTSQHTGQGTAAQQAAWQTGSAYIFRPEALEDAPKLARMLGLERQQMALPRLTCWARLMVRGRIRPVRKLHWTYLTPGKGGRRDGATHWTGSGHSPRSGADALPQRRASGSGLV